MTTDLRALLQELFQHKTLTREQAKAALTSIAGEHHNDMLVASFLTVYMMRNLSVEELEGFRDALLELCEPVELDDIPTIDMCGTGGDGKNTFNISTTATFVAAGAGLKVAKHGNYGVSSACGSSNVLHAMGHHFVHDHAKLRRCLEESGVCFLHAPLFHPAMKAVAPIRSALGIRTFFNVLGPLVNPAFPVAQMTGVFSMELARLYAYLLQQTPKRYAVVRSLDGYDEISLTGAFKVITPNGEEILEPQALGLSQVKPEELAGGATPEDNAKILLNVLRGEGTKAQTDVVCANAAMAIHCARPEVSLTDAVALTHEAIASGKAFGAFQKFMSVSA